MLIPASPPAITDPKVVVVEPPAPARHRNPKLIVLQKELPPAIAQLPDPVPNPPNPSADGGEVSSAPPSFLAYTTVNPPPFPIEGFTNGIGATANSPFFCFFGVSVSSLSTTPTCVPSVPSRFTHIRIRTKQHRRPLGRVARRTPARRLPHHRHAENRHHPEQQYKAPINPSPCPNQPHRSHR